MEVSEMQSTHPEESECSVRNDDPTSPNIPVETKTLESDSDKQASVIKNDDLTSEEPPETEATQTSETKLLNNCEENSLSSFSNQEENALPSDSSAQNESSTMDEENNKELGESNTPGPANSETREEAEEQMEVDEPVETAPVEAESIETLAKESEDAAPAPSTSTEETTVEKPEDKSKERKRSPEPSLPPSETEESKAEDADKEATKDDAEVDAIQKPEDAVESSSVSENKEDDRVQENEVAEGRGEDDSVKDDQVNESGEQDNDDSSRDNPIFEHVNTEKEDSSKTAVGDQTLEEEEFRNSQPQEDPIASDLSEMEITEQVDEDSNNILESEQGADEELCIIPDTERVISQEERDAAAAMVPIRDPTESDTSNSNSVLGVDQPKNSTINSTSEDKFVVSKCTEDSLHSCIQCMVPKTCKYISTTEQRTLYICDDNCLTSFQEENQGKVTMAIVGDLRVKNLAPEPEVNDSSNRKFTFIRKCASCGKKVQNEESTLSWETMDFCNELCLAKYQKKIGSNCTSCNVEVQSNCLGKYCVRFGYDIRQFCSSSCLEEYKKGLKVCSYCQKDISGGGDGFLAPVGDKGHFKDFCSPQCMEKYDIMSNHKKPVVKPGVICSVCRNEKPITIEYEHGGEINLFCSKPCFVAFKFVNTIVPGKCDMCRRFFDDKVLEENTMFYDDAQHSFCSKSCKNIYIIANRRIVPCSWCKVKKYNFDMIRRYSSSGQVLMMCSLNCLSLYQVSVNAVNLKKTKCDQCQKNSQPMYHLTMSDATIRNFCSYNCVMSFQNQFTKTPITLEEGRSSPIPTGAPKRSTRRLTKNTEASSEISLPVISNVQSLAPTTNGTPSTRSTRSKTASAPTNNAGVAQPVKTQIKQQIIVKPNRIPPQRNMGTMCKVIQATKSISCHPSTAHKGTQTDEVKDKMHLIPVPVPIYVPTPLHMFSVPVPMPVPFPLPIPVPIFIPTTRNSANGIMKEIKKIQVKIPTDPFEAELLMMAEMVADDKKEENTDSESDEEDAPAVGDEGTFSPEPVDASNTFGDDMLQMALKMASELDEPAVDLEGALTANTITASQTADGTGTEEAVDDPQPMHQIMERQSFRGRKRGVRSGRHSGQSKRGRRMSQAVDMPIMAPPQPPPPQEPIEKPDANMCLKYTFGVNAWKQWVTTKNAELEKSSRRVKLFKPEILQLTADELNFSLCLFVKEVRKPNGTEYAPDTIYYLCLGIQQYLFENGRIDNIFCDAYYEKFTDCLDEVARKFSVLYNDSHYIVTRVEEEHLWESKQLGAHSPHVLLSTLMFFNTKHFNLTTVDEHMQLSFSHIMKHWKRNPNQPGTAKTPGSRNVLLRFYPPQAALEANTRKKKVYEQQENEENPLRCPVKLYEFYLSKCPESVKTRNDVFYLQPERSCVPDSPVWYSTMPLGREALEKMLHRVKMVKEINVALLTS